MYWCGWLINIRWCLKKVYIWSNTLQTVDGSKKDQTEYHACGVGKKNCSFLAGQSLKGRDGAREAKVVGGATVDGIK